MTTTTDANVRENLRTHPAETKALIEATRFDHPDDAPVIVMTRIFEAPRDLVWKATTRPEHFVQWWGPHGFTNAKCEMDVRPGGGWRVEQCAPDGSTYVFWGEYLEITPPERMVQTQRFMEYPPLYVTSTLEDLGGNRTLFTATINVGSFEGREVLLGQNMEKGAGESHDRLAALLKTMAAA